MSFFKLFSGPSADKLEKNADALFEAGLWGKAKLEYERALHKLKKEPEKSGNRQKKLETKLLQTREALAKEHRNNAVDLIDAGCFEEANELLSLAMEISADKELKAELEGQVRGLHKKMKHENDAAQHDFLYGLEDDKDGETSIQTTSDEYYFALCSTLPDDVREAYHGYGGTFKTGYIALNHGDFQTAATWLSRAMEENPQPESYIPMELATAYVNMDRKTEAQDLLERFLKHHPETLPAYQLLCEIYWEQSDLKRVDTLLASVPEDNTNSIAFFVLKGESLFQAKNFEDARDYYSHFLDDFGWNDTVARELAKVHEAMSDSAKARHLYKQIIAKCKSCHTCHTNIDPMIKHKYAELCFAEDMYDADILESYLSLAREIPGNASLYFDRISKIYAAQGNVDEAERFRIFSEEARAVE